MVNKIIIIILVIIILCYIITLNKDAFNDYQDDKNRVLYNIFPLIDGSFLGSFIPDKVDDTGSNLILTKSLISYEWSNINNSALPENMIVYDLCYNLDKKLLAIGIKYDLESKELIYKIFKKKNNNLESEWISVESDIQMTCLLFDIDEHLLGVSKDGQIYKKKSKNLESEWQGPINFDKPVRKIMYDKDGKLIGIGIEDSFIYKKEGFNWKTSKWSEKYYGKTEVYDLILDFDGCFIATTKDGLKKQEYPNYLSHFIDYYETEENNRILTLSKIIYFRNGVNLLLEKIDDDVSDPLLIDKLNKYIQFKDQAKTMCKNKVFNKIIDNTVNKLANVEVTDKNKTILSTISQLDKINQIEHLIKTLQK